MPIDMSAAKAPPVRSSRTAPTRAKAATTTQATPTISLAEQRFIGISGMGQLAQGLCVLGKQHAQAATFGMHWQPIAKELAILSDTQPTIAKYVDLFITAGPYAALISAVVPFVMQTAANYGLIPASGNGIVSPQTLEAQMKAAIAQKEAEALREQQTALREMAKAQADYNRMVAEQNAQEAETLRINVEQNGWDPALHGVNGAQVR